MPHESAKRVLIAGGGPGALEAALALGNLAGDRVRLTLIADRSTFEYRPESVTEPFGFAAPERFSLPAFAAAQGIVFWRGAIAGVDAAAHRVMLRDQRSLDYDALLLAIGCRAEPAVPGALTFRGHGDVPMVRAALTHLHSGRPLRAAFVVPDETAWSLPAYELALLTARWADRNDLALEPWIITPEGRALGVFGEAASRDVDALLREAGIRLWTGAYAELVEDGRLWLSMEGGLPVDLAVALARPAPHRIPGLPGDRAGFVATDHFGRVDGLDDVYAVGDMTSRPLRQGGLAAQQADAAASAIAAWAGAPVKPEPYRPVLRGMLLTGERPRYLRRGARSGAEQVSEESPWWPPHKIAARELSPYLAAHPELLAS